MSRGFSFGPFSASHSVSINNHVSGAGAGTVETASVQLTTLRKCLLRSPGHDGSLRFLMPTEPLFQDGMRPADAQISPVHTIVNMARARDHGRVPSWTGRAGRRRVGP